MSESPTESTDESTEKKSAKQPDVDGLVNWLLRQARDADRVSSARTALAELRRGLRDDPRDRLIVGKYVVPFLGPEPQTEWQHWQEDCFYLVAALFASHPSYQREQSLGAAMQKIKSESGSIEGRFLNLLSVRPERLRGSLGQIVSLLAARGIPLDWKMLLRDLSYWNDPEKRVQQSWARHFYQGPYDPQLDPMKSDLINGETTDEN